jgi:2-pyrone-4,6-dicarboxylate lactonase
MRYCMPPDPNPKKPGFTPPPKSCDTHFHIFGPPDKFPFAPTRQYTPPAAPLEHYSQMAAVIGIERGVVVQPSVHGLDNTATLDAIARSGGRFLGVGRVDDAVTSEQLARLHEGGIRGVRFNLLDRPRGNVELDVFDRAVEKINGLGWSVDLHIDPKNLLAQEKRIRSLPGRVVVDHIARVNPAEGTAQPGFELLLDLMKDGRYWVKLSGIDKICKLDLYSDREPGWRGVIPFARAVVEAAPDRVIWGTDWPHSNIFAPGKTPNDGELLDLLLDLAPEETVRNRILVDNPARLYGFADR